MRDAAIDHFRQPRPDDQRASSRGAPPLDGVFAEGPGPRPAKPPRQAATSASVAARRLGGGRSSPDAGGAPRAGSLAGRLLRVRPLKAVAVAAFAASLVGIVANAMMFQRGRHPGPFFGLGRSIDGQADPAPTAAAPPPAAPGPAERTGAIAPPPPAAPAAQVQPAPPVKAAAPPAKAHRAAETSDGPTPIHHARPGHAPAPKPADKGIAKADADKPAAHAPHPKAEAADKPAAKADAADKKPVRAAHAKPEAVDRAADAPEPPPRPKRHAAADAGKAQIKPD